MPAHTQEALYDPGTIREIHIRFSEKNWRHILDSLFKNEGDEGRLKGEVTIDGTCLKNTGIRYKGYSSYNENTLKNPFNIDLNYCVKSQNYQGFSKIKLSNVIHDPSFVREVLAYEIARKYMPAARANFARLLINDTLIGLYTNVEAVSDEFNRRHFGTGDRPFIKGEPAKLIYPFGENANLSNSNGPDSMAYQPYYKLQSEYGWGDLYRLIDLLNNAPGQAGDVLDIDRTLWMHAFNFVLLNLDSYIGYAQNYYLSMDKNGRFNPVIWDLNMSFGSFRDSDGSYHFLGVTIPELASLDPLEHLSFSVSPRPLMTNLFKNDTLRKMYLAHMRTLVDENIRTGSYYQRGKELRELITGEVLNDPNKFYSFDDFILNLDTTVGGTGSMIRYPGIRTLMEARMAYLDTLPGYSHAPTISSVSHEPVIPEIGGEMAVRARVDGATMVFAGFRDNSGGIFTQQTMFDDGNHNDSLAGDGIYGISVPVNGNTVQYYIYAQNDSAGAFLPPGAEYDHYTVQPIPRYHDMVINEIRFGYSSIPTSATRTCEGWLELINLTTESIDLEGFSVTDNPAEPKKWMIPDTSVASGEYVMIRSAADQAPGIHLSFDLNPSGGILWFMGPSGTIVDSVSYPSLGPQRSAGRYPNGYGNLGYMTPTYARPNQYAGSTGSVPLVYPNPADKTLYVETYASAKLISLELLDAMGRIVVHTSVNPGSVSPANLSIFSFDVSACPKGIYFLKAKNDDFESVSKVIVY